MEEPVEDAVVDGLAAMRIAARPAENIAKKRRDSDFKVTAFQAAIAMPDLMDPQPNSDPSTSDPSTSDPSTGDDTSPSSFLGTPYSTTLQFDYPFPISNAPRDPTLQATPLPPTVLSIASSLGSAPSMVTAAAVGVSSEESSDGSAPSNPLPSLVSSIAASPDLPVNNNLSDLRSISNMSTSSLNSTHSGHTAPGIGIGMILSSNASVHSIPPPSSSLPSNHHHMQANSPPGTTTGSRHNKGRHSLSISPMPPPALAIQTSMVKPMQSPPSARRTSKTQAQMVSLLGSTGSDVSHESNIQSRPPSGSVSSLSITSLQLLTGPGEPPIPPSLLNKLGRPRNTSTTSNTSSYFTTNVTLYKSHNSRDFFGSPVNEGVPFASAPNSPPTTLGTDSSVDVSRPPYSAAPKSGFSSFRPSLNRSNTTSGPTTSTFSRPFFGRSNTTAPAPNPALQSRAYAQHLRHQQEQQLKLQEEQRKKAEKKEKKEKKKEKSRRPSLSLSRSVSSSSSSSAKTRASSSSKSPPSTSSSSSQADGFRLSPSQRSLVENALDESEGSTSPEGAKKSKPRRRSSVRRALEKTGSLVGFNLNLNASKRGGHH